MGNFTTSCLGVLPLQSMPARMVLSGRNKTSYLPISLYKISHKILTLHFKIPHLLHYKADDGQTIRITYGEDREPLVSMIKLMGRGLRATEGAPVLKALNTCRKSSLLC